MVIEFIENKFSPNIFIANAQTLQDKLDLGALLSRYSRTHKSIKELYESEFISNPNRGSEFYKKNFGQYGDESISELVPVGFAICAENVPKLWGGNIFHYRHLSGIEKSSRYMKTLDYYKDGGLVMNQKYLDTCESHMDKFRKHYEHTKSELTAQYKDGTKETDTAIESKTLDYSRHLLPLSTLTSFGIVANLRSWINILSKESAKYSPESAYTKKFLNPITELLIENFSSIINSKKLIEEFNKNLITYRSENKDRDWYLVHNKRFEILEQPSKPWVRFIRQMLIYSRAKKQKALRELEQLSFTINIPWIDIGTFFDFQRHRHLSIMIVKTMFYKNAVLESDRLSCSLNTLMNIIVTGNLREWIHAVELRTQQTGHYRYRHIFQKIGELIAQAMDMNKELVFPYADWRTDKEIGLGRRESEKKIEEGVGKI